MTQKMVIVLISAALAAGCGRSQKAQRVDQNYQVVQEGQASGVTSTINAPGETPPPLTDTAIDTTTNFTLPDNPAPLGTQQPNSVAGTFPAYPPAYPPSTAPRPRVQQPPPMSSGSTQPRPLEQERPQPVPTDTTATQAPPPPTETTATQAPPPPPTTTTKTDSTKTDTGEKTDSTKTDTTKTDTTSTEKPPV